MKQPLLLIVAAHLSILTIFILGQTECLPRGIFACPEQLQAEYIISLVTIILTVSVVLAVWYQSPTVSQSRQRRLSGLVWVVPAVTLVIIIDIASYYLTLRTTGLLCAAVAYLMLWYSYATTQRHHRQL